MKTTYLIGIMICCLALACKKPRASCYNAELEKQAKEWFCTTDCPGVIGCDGKKYCNECEAARHGISVPK